MSGIVITWILGIIIFGAFALVLRKIYHNFISGGGCCGSESKSCSGGCCGCHSEDQVDKEHAVEKK